MDKVIAILVLIVGISFFAWIGSICYHAYKDSQPRFPSEDSSKHSVDYSKSWPIIVDNGKHNIGIYGEVLPESTNKE